MSDQYGNGFTTKEILLEFREEMRREFRTMRTSFDDHETRIRSTESSMARVKGALAIVVVTAPVVAAIAASYIH